MDNRYIYQIPTKRVFELRKGEKFIWAASEWIVSYYSMNRIFFCRLRRGGIGSGARDNYNSFGLANQMRVEIIGGEL